jgi:hypothetical protein
MSIINYESPDYQRMVQKAMASPLARTNPALQRNLQTQYTKQVMTQRQRMDSAIRSKMRSEMETDYSQKSLGLKERGMGLAEEAQALKGKAFEQSVQGNLIDEQFKSSRLSLDDRRVQDDIDDLNTQSWMGLIPAVWGAYEGNRRARATDELAETRLQFAKGQMRDAGMNPDVRQQPAGQMHVQPATGTSTKKKSWFNPFSTPQNILR